VIIGGTFLWVALSIVVGVAANSRGRNSLIWILLSLFLSPLIAGLLLLALPRDETYLSGEIRIEGRSATFGSVVGSIFQAILVFIGTAFLIWFCVRYFS
jgi:hypothetical protein